MGIEYPADTWLETGRLWPRFTALYQWRDKVLSFWDLDVGEESHYWKETETNHVILFMIQVIVYTGILNNNIFYKETKKGHWDEVAHIFNSST